MNHYEEMKRRAQAEQEQVELRSEKVRNLIGQMPPFLIRWGNTVLLLVLVALGAAYAWLFL